jgi:adenylosuccinate synthase
LGRKVVPTYREFTPWREDVRGARSLADLPREARAYIEAVESLVGVPFCLISVGPNRDDTIELSDVFSM